MTDLVLKKADLEQALVSVTDELKSAVEKANGEVAEAKAASVESKAALEALAVKSGEIHERLVELEQRASADHVEAAAESIGDTITKSDKFSGLAEGGMRSARWEMKTAIINATGASQPLVAADRIQGIHTTPNRFLTMRDLLPRTVTSSNLVEFTRENAFTNNAGPQIGGSPEAYENVTKPESAVTFTLASEPVVTLAHFIPLSKQVMSDAPQLASFINGRLMYGLKLYEETQLLSGTGANHQLNGLITQATAYTVESPNLTNEIDIIRDAITQAQVGEYRPNFLVLNPNDWDSIERRKVGGSDDRYVVGDPANGLLAPRLWGLPVVVTNSIASGTFLLGDSNGCSIYDREQAAVTISYEEGNNFTKNMVTVLAEERLALCVHRTEAFITGSL